MRVATRRIAIALLAFAVSRCSAAPRSNWLPPSSAPACTFNLNSKLNIVVVSPENNAVVSPAGVTITESLQYYSPGIPLFWGSQDIVTVSAANGTSIAVLLKNINTGVGARPYWVGSTPPLAPHTYYEILESQSLPQGAKPEVIGCFTTQ